MLVNAVICDNDTIIWFFSCFKITQYIQDAVIRRLKRLRQAFSIKLIISVFYAVFELQKLRQPHETFIRKGVFAMFALINFAEMINRYPLF